MPAANLALVAKSNSGQRLGNIIESTLLPALSEQLGSLENNGKTTPAAHFKGRTGYNPEFLEGWAIPLPLATGTTEKDMLPVGEGVELTYMHFSIVMSRSRRLAMLTATNIDGQQSKQGVGRSDRWFLDGRIREDEQWGNDLYKDNRLDRGHMVRREDPVWGDDAMTANLDTFHYTNSCPQMDIFNQQTWLGIENYILKTARVNEMKVNVYTGPFFSHNDMEYNGARIPGAFWKVVAVVLEDGRPSATAYKISQEKELGQLESVYGPYRTYQISILEVMDGTGIDFGTLSPYDGFSAQQLESKQFPKKLIKDLNDIML